MNQKTLEKTLYHPRAWVYARATEYGPALSALCESAHSAGYVLVGQSHDLPQRFYRRHSGRNALLHAVRKELLDDVFITRLPSYPENVIGCAAFCYYSSAKAFVSTQPRSTCGMTCTATGWTTSW